MEYKNIVFKTFYKFFTPTIISSTAVAFIFITDMIISGNFIGEKAIITIGLSLPVTMLITLFTFLFGLGAANAVSIEIGHGNKEICNKIFSLSIYTVIILGAIISFFEKLYLNKILYILGASDSGVYYEANLYIGTIIKGFPFMITAPIAVIFLRNDNNPKLAMIAVVISGLINIVLDIVFICFMNMGIFGAALATVISQAVKLVIAVLHFIDKKGTMKFTNKIDFKCYAYIFKFGISCSLICILQTLLTFIINRVLINKGGDNAVAIYAVLKYLITFIYALFDGVTEAVQPILGVYYGENENRNIQYAVEVSLKTIIYIAFIIFITLELFAPFICLMFGIKDINLISNTISAIRIIAFLSITSAVIADMGSYYRATEKISISFIIVMFSNLISPVFLIYLNVYILGFGINGVWYALVEADYITIFVWICSCFLKSGTMDLYMLSNNKNDIEAKFTLLIKDRLENISSAMTYIDAFCKDNSISNTKKNLIFLCIEEIVVNVNKIGFKDNKEHYIDIKIVKSCVGDIIIRIRDNTDFFDPTLIRDIDIRYENESEDFNEFGIMLVKKCCKSFSYKRAIGFNNLLVII